MLTDYNYKRRVSRMFPFQLLRVEALQQSDRLLLVFNRIHSIRLCLIFCTFSNNGWGRNSYRYRLFGLKAKWCIYFVFRYIFREIMWNHVLHVIREWKLNCNLISFIVFKMGKIWMLNSFTLSPFLIGQMKIIYLHAFTIKLAVPILSDSNRQLKLDNHILWAAAKMKKILQ